MRFRRRPPLDGLNLSSRKEMAFERKKKREQERHPLFADEIAAGQSSWDQEATRREILSHRIEQEWRGRIASWWKKGRRLYFAEPIEVRQKIMAEWRAWTGPADATYFIYIVEIHNGTMATRDQAMKAATLAARRKARAEVGIQLHLEEA